MRGHATQKATTDGYDAYPCHPREAGTRHPAVYQPLCQQSNGARPAQYHAALRSDARLRPGRLSSPLLLRPRRTAQPSPLSSRRFPCSRAVPAHSRGMHRIAALFSRHAPKCIESVCQLQIPENVAPVGGWGVGRESPIVQCFRWEEKAMQRAVTLGGRRRVAALPQRWEQKVDQRGDGPRLDRRNRWT